MNAERGEGFQERGIMCPSSSLFLLQCLPCYCHASEIPSKDVLEAQIKGGILPEHRTRMGLKWLQEESVPPGTEETVGIERRVWRKLSKLQRQTTETCKASPPVETAGLKRHSQRGQGAETRGLCLCSASSGQPPILLDLPAHGSHSSLLQAEESSQHLHTVGTPYM